ncbi:MAG: hypothetical protein JJU12_04085 [Chlamydiales bacterium]|nr:hypothetical protein [Chlamydiales bacterium]
MGTKNILKKYFKIEAKICRWAERHSLPLLRYSFALIYFWFGWLKVLGISPADELVFRSTRWLQFPYFVTYLGIWEVLIGIFFAIRKLNRLALLMFFLKIPGTFFPLFTDPEECFTICPFGLTLEGQYIFKNLILVAGALVLVASLQKKSNRTGES